MMMPPLIGLREWRAIQSICSFTDNLEVDEEAPGRLCADLTLVQSRIAQLG